MLCTWLCSSAWAGGGPAIAPGGARTCSLSSMPATWPGYAAWGGGEPAPTRPKRRIGMCTPGLPEELSGRLWEPLTPMTPEFASVAQAQFEALGMRLQASRAAIFFRRENPRTGSLEFVPAAVWPATQRVWVVGEGVLASVDHRSLPGGTDAGQLMPSYPFLTRAASELPDSGLSVPLIHGATVLGILAVWRQGQCRHDQAEPAPDTHAADTARGGIPGSAGGASTAGRLGADAAGGPGADTVGGREATPHPAAACASPSRVGWTEAELGDLEVSFLVVLFSTLGVGGQCRQRGALEVEVCGWGGCA